MIQKIFNNIPWDKSEQQVFKKVNKSVIGRYRVFLETIRDGPVFPCVCCHRLLYNNSVIEIKSLQEFKEALYHIDENLFETVGYVKNHQEPDRTLILLNVPTVTCAAEIVNVL